MAASGFGSRAILFVSALFGAVALQFGSAAAAEHVTLMTDFPPVPMHAALYVAKAKGWYKDAGLDVEIEDGHGSNNTIQLVAAGQVDVGYVELGPLMPARQAGLQVISIAGFTRSTDLGLAYDAKLGKVTPKVLAAQPILCFAGSYWQPFIKPFFSAAGVDPATLKILNVNVAALWSSFMAGKAQSILSAPPYGLPLVQRVRPARAIMASEYGINVLGYGLVVRDAEVKGRGAMLAKLAQATARAWQYLLDGHDTEGIQDMMKLRPNVKPDPVVAEQQLRNYEKLVYTPNDKGLAMGLQSEKDWAEAIETGERAGLIKPGHRPAEFYTNALMTMK
jgi:NitT/TauT family transport system substrate-binding protein